MAFSSTSSRPGRTPRMVDDARNVMLAEEALKHAELRLRKHAARMRFQLVPLQTTNCSLGVGISESEHPGGKRVRFHFPEIRSASNFYIDRPFSSIQFQLPDVSHLDVPKFLLHSGSKSHEIFIESVAAPASLDTDDSSDFTNIPSRDYIADFNESGDLEAWSKRRRSDMASKLITYLLFRPLFQSEHVRGGVHTLEHPRFEPLDVFIGLLDS